MRPIFVAIFFTVFFTLYGLLNYYVINRIGQTLVFIGFTNKYLFILIILASAYPAARLLELISTNFITHFLVYIGSLYLALFVYGLLFIAVVDFVRLVDHFLPFIKKISAGNLTALCRYTFFTLAATSLILTTAGFFNARRLRLRTINVNIAKKAGDRQTLKIVMASDIHLGAIIGIPRLQEVVNKINSLKPDIILFAGDVVDEDTSIVIEKGMAVFLKKLKAPLGVYAVTGNHEYIKNKKQAVGFLRDGGITVLEDRVIKVADSFYLAGRKDMLAKNLGKGRKELADILQGIDSTKPLILLDHQPFRLEQAETNGVDLQLSGHTHHGQMFPFNLLTKKIFEQSWGYLKKGSTHYYISCGVGTWGPPVRIGSVPEIVEINLRFQ